MATRIQIRRDTSTNWEANNPVLALGEPGLETDTFIIKYGDGSSAWNNLPYANIDSLSDFTTTDLKEGNNLYFTNARVYANTIASGFVSNTYATNAQLTSFLSSFITVTQLTNYATLAQLQSTTTANVTELTNLYYTNARAYANIIGAGFAPDTFATNAQLATYATNAQLATYATNAQVASFATNAQLATYATNAQVASFATNNQLNTYVTIVQLAGTTSGSITESVNLYFTNARATSALSNTTANITLGNVMRLVNYTYDQMQALTGAQKGMIVFETSNNIFRGYNGTAWSNLG